DVHVVPSGDEQLVESPDALEGLLPEGHVAARDVLCPVVGHQDVDRVAGTLGHGPLYQPPVGHWQVRPAGGGDVAVVEREHQVVGPLGMAGGVGVEKGHDVAARGGDARVAATAQPPVGQLDEVDGK